MILIFTIHHKELIPMFEKKVKCLIGSQYLNSRSMNTKNKAMLWCHI